jgi:excinuclease UvrABC ATPase subunit
VAGFQAARGTGSFRPLRVLHELTDAGNTMTVIKHIQQVIKTADWFWIWGVGATAGVS